MKRPQKNNPPKWTHGHPESPVHLVMMQPQSELVLHTHNYVELVCVTGGHGVHLLADAAWPIQRGDVFVIPPDTKHGYDDCDDLHLINCCVESAWCERSELRAIPGYNAFIALEPLLRAQQDFAAHLHLEEENLERIINYITGMDRELVQQEPGFIRSIKHRLDLLFIDLARKHSAGGGQNHEALLQLEAVLRYIDEHLDSELPLKHLCDKAAMSPSTLTRYFQRCFQCSPIHYVLQRRLTRAKQLLQSESTAIKEIAKQVGFRDANYFSRMCKKYLHATPKELRG